MGFSGEEKGAVCGAERPFQDKRDIENTVRSLNRIRDQ